MNASSSKQPSQLEQLGAASAGIVHDVNNQLMMIMNHLEAGDIRGAREATETCASLTGSLLDYCRDAHLVLRAVDLSRFVAANASSLNVPSAIRLTLELDTEQPLILADYTCLTRILHNLVSNSVAAIEGSGSITVAVARNELRVTDDGPGIPVRHRSRIFEPFFTTKGRTKGSSKAEGGTGLGLAIVREIMRQLGGSVSLASTGRDGTTFLLRFRAAPQAPRT